MEFLPRPPVRGMSLRVWALHAALLLCPFLGCALLSGCNPSALAMMLMPFVDDRVPARCTLSAKDKETTVAIVTWFGNRDLQLWPELMPCDQELSEKLAVALAQRFQKNKEKVKIVPNGQVRPYQSKVVNAAWSPAELGQKVKADYVIALEINSLSLHEKSSYQTLFRGIAEIAVKVYDVNKPTDKVIFDDIFQTAYPKDNPIEANGSLQMFRGAFMVRTARDLSRWFAASSSDEQMYKMSTD
jgi:hypothetical protein